MRPFTPFIPAALLTAALTACGGGGGGSNDGMATASFDVNIVGNTATSIQPGSVITLTGAASTSDAPLSTLAWTSTGSAGAPLLSFANANCTVGAKTTNNKSSNWDCPITVTAPITAAAASKYTLVFTAKDTLGNTRTTSRDISVNYDPAYAVKDSGIAGQSFSTVAGTTSTLSCQAGAGSSISWTIVDNGGQPISLSSYDTAQTNFLAPSVTSATNYKFQCKVTDANQLVTLGNVTVTVNPPAVILPTSVQVSAAQSIKVGAVATATITLTGGSNVPQMYYKWSISPTITLAGANTATTSLVGPTVAAPTTYTLTVQYGTQPITDTYAGMGQAQTVIVVSP